MNTLKNLILKTRRITHVFILIHRIKDGGWQVFIAIEGYSKLLNQHGRFNGLVFNKVDNLVDGIPE